MSRSNVVRLVSTQGMSREQWLAVRQGGIGSSDAAVAAGLSPYKSPLELWLEKTGRKPADDLSQSEAVFQHLLQVRSELGELEQSESLLRQQLQSAMGEATAARFTGGRISWKCAKDSLRFDQQRFQSEHPELVSQYQQISPGSRRFLVQINKAKQQAA